MPHTSFIASGESDKQHMLKALGVTAVDALFEDIPAELRDETFALENGVPELDMMRRMRETAAGNRTDLLNFCGAGFYDHYIPAAVDTLAARGEFLTPYTPYQPEASQGTLQAIYEYQTAIARLTGMEASNASMYDGGSALFEGLMMALRCTRRRRVLVDCGVNPIYRSMLRSYTRYLEVDYEEIDTADGLADREEFRNRLEGDVGAVLLQNPNFFGCVDDIADIGELAHSRGALLVVSTYPTALGIIRPPGAMGADIVTGEGQCLGLPLSFGGPYLGFLATRKKYVRKMPGRVAGATFDGEGRRGYVLTMQTREQHIRREKATSNICTNEALCALRAVIYLSLAGKGGLPEVSRACAAKAAYARRKLCELPGVKPAFEHSFFNEFVLDLPGNAGEFTAGLLEQGIAAGIPLSRYYADRDNSLLLAFTEQRSRAEIDRLAAAMEKML